MIRAKCPTCGKTFEGETLAALPFFPFCSERCRLVDLGRWLDGDYVIPGKDGTAATNGSAAVSRLDDDEE